MLVFYLGMGLPRRVQAGLDGLELGTGAIASSAGPLAAVAWEGGSCVAVATLAPSARAFLTGAGEVSPEKEQRPRLRSPKPQARPGFARVAGSG